MSLQESPCASPTRRPVYARVANSGHHERGRAASSWLSSAASSQRSRPADSRSRGRAGRYTPISRSCSHQVFVDIGKAKFTIGEETEHIEPPGIPEAMQRPLHCFSELFTRRAGRELQTRQALPADLDDVPGALWSLVNAHLALLRSSINARMSAWRQRRVWGAICIARWPTTS